MNMCNKKEKERLIKQLILSTKIYYTNLSFRCKAGLGFSDYAIRVLLSSRSKNVNSPYNSQKIYLKKRLMNPFYVLFVSLLTPLPCSFLIITPLNPPPQIPLSLFWCPQWMSPWTCPLLPPSSNHSISSVVIYIDNILTYWISKKQGDWIPASSGL